MTSPASPAAPPFKVDPDPEAVIAYLSQKLQQQTSETAVTWAAVQKLHAENVRLEQELADLRSARPA